MPYVFIAFGALVVAFIAVVLIRTLRFTPKALPTPSDAEIAFDKEKAVDDLARLVRCKTVSRIDHVGEDLE